MGLFDHREHHRIEAIDSSVSPFGGRPFTNGGNLTQQNGAVGLGFDRHLAQIFKHLGRIGPQTGDHPHWAFQRAVLGEAARGVEVVVADSEIDIGEGDPIVEHFSRIDKHLVLFAIATQNDHLGDAWLF